jgi:hypothetical protein
MVDLDAVNSLSQIVERSHVEERSDSELTTAPWYARHVDKLIW